MPKFPWPTVGGHDFYEVMSAMQKSIRRGEEEATLFWASELYLSEYEDHAWSRFQIIASEDIGLAANGVCMLVHTLHERWTEKKKKELHGEARLYFIHAALILVRAPKSRIVDNALITIFEGERPKLDIPDYALDVHTTRGKALGHGVEHFFDEGAKLVNETLTDPYRERAKQARSKVVAQPQSKFDEFFKLKDDP
jgi:replication-associated recombination protein RarA